jgi:lipoprotein-anchoring transpeptidase ErfK/SrfK
MNRRGFILTLILATVTIVLFASPALGSRRAAMDPAQECAARLQTLLARSNFSPGLIDSKPGRKTKIAIEHFQRANGLDVTGSANDPTLAALANTSHLSPDAAWTFEYAITNADKALITGPIPEDWNERAALDVSGYADLLELLAERGWCSPDLVIALNPDVQIDALQPGERVVLPDTRIKPLTKLDRLEIELEAKLVLGFDADGRQIFLTHCSIAREVGKRPVGELRVKVVAANPDYTFDPKVWPEVTNVDRKLRIAPGPRNPVGSAWIGLDRPGYGMHGTVRPQDIGKTGSHGCFRLANWDATRLANAVRTGMTVVVRE